MANISNIAAAAISKGRFVAWNGTADRAAEATTRAALVQGVTLNSVASGEPVGIAGVGSLVSIEVGAAGVAASDEYVTVDEATGDGRGVGASSTQIAHARNINAQAAAAGEFITVEVINAFTVA